MGGVFGHQGRGAAAQVGAGLVIQKARAVVQAHQTAFFCHDPDHLIGQVAAVGGQSAAVGVAGRKGSGAVLRNVPEALIGQVAHIGNDVQALHLGQELEALLLQAGLGVGHTGPDGAVAGHHVGAGQLVFVVPGQGHHPHAQLVHPAQHAQTALAAAGLLNGQHSADLARLGVFADILGAVDRGDPVGIPLHHPLEHVDLFQRRHQRVRARGGVGQIHKGGKALEHVVALLQLFQIDVAVVVGKGLPVAPHLRAPQLAQGVTM